MVKLTISLPRGLRDEIHRAKENDRLKFNISKICRRALERAVRQVDYEITTA